MQTLTYTAHNTKLFSYTGSKLRFASSFEKVHKQFDKEIVVDTYIEMFAGTLASMFHNLIHVKANKVVINDINSRLINLYKQIKTNPDAIWEKYILLENEFNRIAPDFPKGTGKRVPKEVREKHTDIKAFFFEARNLFNTIELDDNNAALLIFIMNHAFQGMYNENKQGDFNTAFNWEYKPKNTQTVKDTIDNLHQFFNSREVVFESMDAFALTAKYEEKSTFIYLDPPYSNSDIQYNSKSENSFDLVDTHLDLIKKCEKYDFVMYSNNHEECFIKEFDTHVNFSRTKFGTTSTKKQSLEILAIKSNIQEIKAIPIMELLGIKPKHTPVNNILEDKQEIKTLRCATAFSGIGAFEEAIKNIGIAHSNEFMVEIDKFARQTYLENHAVNNVFEDITKINPKTLPVIDIFTFGSPCQSFSTQGKRGGLEDTRGTLIFNGLQIIREKQPKYFIFENVRGLMSHDKGKTFQTILSAFKELDYKIEFQVLNSKNFGSPQHRNRIFIVGIRSDIKQTFTFPNPSPVSNCINDYIKTGTDYTDYLYDSSKAVSKEANKNTDIKITYEFPHLKFESDKRVCSTAGIAPCIRASGQTHFFDTKNNLFRYLTVKELAEIQGFKDFNFPVSKTQARKQIGNSITVNVMESLLKNLLQEYLPVEIEEPLAA